MMLGQVMSLSQIYIYIHIYIYMCVWKVQQSEQTLLVQIMQSSQQQCQAIYGIVFLPWKKQT